jgi:hypothetical protein
MMAKAEIKKRTMLTSPGGAEGADVEPASSAPLLKSRKPGADEATAIEVKVNPKAEEAKPEKPAEEAAPPAAEPEAKPAEAKKELKLEPTKAVPPKEKAPEPAQTDENAVSPPTEEAKDDAKPDDTKPKTDAKAPPPDPKKISQEDAEKAKHHEEILKLIESRRYELPINAVEKRKTKRFIALGIVLSLLLVLAWFDIALDAGLVDLPNIKPVTHFFSS